MMQHRARAVAVVQGWAQESDHHVARAVAVVQPYPQESDPVLRRTTLRGHTTMMQTETMTRYHGDLWHADASTIRTAAEAIMRHRGYPVAQVHRLTSGLSVEVTLTNGHSVTLGEDVIRRYVWRNTAR
jgi:hypothetical protein